MAILINVQFPLRKDTGPIVRDALKKEILTRDQVIGVSLLFHGTGFHDRTPVIQISVVEMTQNALAKFQVDTAAWIRERELQLSLNYE